MFEGKPHPRLFAALAHFDKCVGEMRDMLPRLSDLRAPFAEMIAGFEKRLPGFDVNIGNLPFCIALELAPWIHHDGNYTETIAIDGDDRLSKPWNKYLVIITLEPTDDPQSPRWQGPVVLRGMSRSGLMHTMAGHGPFQQEPCATFGYY